MTKYNYMHPAQMQEALDALGIDIKISVEEEIHNEITEYEILLDQFMDEGNSWAEASRMALNTLGRDLSDIPF